MSSTRQQVSRQSRAGLKVGFYYSLLDWRFPGYFEGPKKNPRSFNAMVAQAHAQVKELLTRYGKIDIMWYDGGWFPFLDPKVRFTMQPKLWKAAELNAMVLVPICPHTLSNRPIVIGGDSRVEIRICPAHHDHVRVTCDGQTNMPVGRDQTLRIRKAEHSIRLIHPRGHDHFDILRAKLMAVFDKAQQRIRETLDEAVADGTIEPLDSDNTAEAMLAYLEGMILLAKAHNDPEVLYRLGPAIKTIRIEQQRNEQQ